jgi:hypothetical protein
MDPDARGALILAELSRLLETPWFNDAPRRSDALEKVTLASLRGESVPPAALAESLYGIAGRNQVNAARAMWKEVRKGLEIEAPPDGGGSRVRFRPMGAPYRIEFQVQEEPAARTSAAAPVRAASRIPSRASRGLVAAVASGLALAGALIVAALRGGGDGIALVRYTREGVRLLDARGRRLAEQEALLASMTGCPVDAPGDGLERSRALVARGPDGGHDRLVLACAPGAEDPRAGLHVLDRKTLAVLGTVPFPWRGAGGPALEVLTGSHGRRDSSTWRVAGLAAAELDPELPGDELIVTLCHNPDYLAEVIVVGWKDGPTALGILWNAGHLSGAEAFDLDGDGGLEVLAAGVSNDFHRPILAVLEPRGQEARTPSGPRSLVPPSLRAVPETAETIVLPRTEVSWSPLYREVHAIARVLDPSNLPDLLVVEVEDVGEEPHGARRLRWTFDLRRRRVEVDLVDYDWYLIEMLSLIELGKVRDDWGIAATRKLEAYARALAGEVRYLGAPARRFIPPPAEASPE